MHLLSDGLRLLDGHLHVPENADALVDAGLEVEHLHVPVDTDAIVAAGQPDDADAPVDAGLVDTDALVAAGLEIEHEVWGLDMMAV